MNFTRLGYVTERAEIGEHREAILAVTIPERPGAFLEFCRTIGERSVTEFNYRLAARDEAHIFVGIEVSGRDEAQAIVAALAAHGYACVDLSDDDIAKTHVRHMVGGRTPHAADEALFSFEFPERPGALMQFLTALGAQWNISLFHYRNHGAAFGRVLCGFEVPAAERPALRERLDRLGFAYAADAGYDDLRVVPTSGQHDAILCPHHGGRSNSPKIPKPPSGAYQRLIYSYGPSNTYKHPLLNTYDPHHLADWFDNRTGVTKPTPPPHIVRNTEDRTSKGLGHVGFDWTTSASTSALACGADLDIQQK
jgi:hypothetical protein